MSLNSAQNDIIKPRLMSIDSLLNSESDRRSSIPRNTSYDNMATSAEANVLVIYTGGTIGMTRNSNNGMFVCLCFFFVFGIYFYFMMEMKDNVSQNIVYDEK